MTVKVNPVFISPDGKPRKPFCQTCGVYHELFGNQYRCPQCGDSDAEQAKKADRKILVADNPQPMIKSRKGKKKQEDADLPRNAQWVEKSGD